MLAKKIAAQWHPLKLWKYETGVSCEHTLMNTSIKVLRCYEPTQAAAQDGSKNNGNLINV